jgi:hypothetical protein
MGSYTLPRSQGNWASRTAIAAAVVSACGGGGEPRAVEERRWQAGAPVMPLRLACCYQQGSGAPSDCVPLSRAGSDRIPLWGSRLVHHSRDEHRHLQRLLIV